MGSLPLLSLALSPLLFQLDLAYLQDEDGETSEGESGEGESGEGEDTFEEEEAWGRLQLTPNWYHWF